LQIGKEERAAYTRARPKGTPEMKQQRKTRTTVLTSIIVVHESYGITKHPYTINPMENPCCRELKMRIGSHSSTGLSMK